MAETEMVKQQIEAEIRRMSNKGVRLSVIRGRIDLSRRRFRKDPGMLRMLNAIEMEYVIKRLGGLPYAK